MIDWKLLSLIESTVVVVPPVLLMPFSVPDVAALKVHPLMLLELMLMATVAAPVFWMRLVVPLVAFVALPERVLLLMLTVAAEAEETMPVKAPEVAVV